MYKRLGTKKVGKKASHRKSMVRNQIRSLFKSGYLVTTTPKAKLLKSNVESIVHKKYSDDQLAVRRSLEVVFGTDRKLVDKMLQVIKEGGVKVKLHKVGFRDGDNAEISKITLDGLKSEKKAAKKSAKAVKSEKKEEPKEDAKKTQVQESRSDSFGKKLSKSLKSTFTGSKERSRTRSGL